MLKRRFPSCCLFLFALLLGSALPLQAKAIKVIAGTSHIEDIVRDLSGGQAEVFTIIKGSSCPGHETIKTTDFVFAAEADMMLVHGFQQNMPWLVDMLEAVKNRNERLVVLKTKGSWLLPDVQKDAVRAIAQALSLALPEETGAIDARAQKRLARVDAVSGEIRAKLAPLKGRAVAVAAMQAEFASWAGLEVLRSYGRGEDMHTRELAQMVDALRGRSLAGVVDNYQSGSDAGLPLAVELKVPHVVLSNFPGSSEDAQDYFSLLRHNADQLFKLGD